MRKWLPLFICFCTTPIFGQNPQPAAAPTANPGEVAPLDLAINQVKAALDEYQKNRGGGADLLPALSSAEFDFKTTTATTVGGAVNLFIFKFGGSHEYDVVNDVTYTYSFPKPSPPPAGLASNKKPPSLKDALAQAIQSAAAAVKTSGNLGKLTFNKLTVNLSYGVKWDGNIGANVPIQFVTVGLNADKNKNTVQSVKVVFGQ